VIVDDTNLIKELVMIRINLGEMNELAHFIQTMRDKEEIAVEMEMEKQEKPVVNGNKTVKLEMAAELLMQGLSEEAVCRILNLSSELLHEKLRF